MQRMMHIRTGRDTTNEAHCSTIEYAWVRGQWPDLDRQEYCTVQQQKAFLGFTDLFGISDPSHYQSGMVWGLVVGMFCCGSAKTFILGVSF